MKCRETSLEGEGFVKIPQDSPCKMVLWKLLNTLGSMFRACGLFQLNPEARGEYLTSRLSWPATWLLVTRVYPTYLVDELRPCVLRPLIIGLMVVLLTFFFLNGEYGFTSMGSWCYSTEWVWNLKKKLCSIASGKWNDSRVSLQGFDIRYIMF